MVASDSLAHTHTKVWSLVKLEKCSCLQNIFYQIAYHSWAILSTPSDLLASFSNLRNSQKKEKRAVKKSEKQRRPAMTKNSRRRSASLSWSWWIRARLSRSLRCCLMRAGLTRTRRTNVIRLTSAAIALLLGPKQIINVVDERRENFSLSFSRYRKVAPTHAKNSRKEREKQQEKQFRLFLRLSTYTILVSRFTDLKSTIRDFSTHTTARRTALSRATLCVSRVCFNAWFHALSVVW